ncbi:MAG: restriction endonuclease, partial [Clostridiales bacterium]|nr:restriction endonuclease [Clostridiales bacterium]
KSFEENISDLYFNTAGYLYDEPLMLLKQELREPAMYNSVITAIAGGASRLNEISTKIDEDRAKAIKYLDTLINLRILYKEYPFGDNPAKSRKGVYKISDNCFSFWYRYVFPDRTAVEQGTGKAVLRSIMPSINSFIGKPFEEICLQYLIHKNNSDELPFVFTRSGRWWGNNPKTKSQEEIDLILSSSDNKNAIFAECKWRNEIKGAQVLTELMEKASLFENYENKYYYVFSKADFSADCRELANKFGNVKLINLADLFEGI